MGPKSHCTLQLGLIFNFLMPIHYIKKKMLNAGEHKEENIVSTLFLPCLSFLGREDPLEKG